jgi:hypothetical protein
MATLTTYTKSTEANILSNPPSADGEMAFATDTKKLFLSEGTDWVFWSPTKYLGKYQLGSELVARPFNHIDISQTNTCLDSNGLAVTDGGSVARIRDLISNSYVETSTALQQPTMVSAAGTTPLALPNGDARINNLPVLQFDGSQYLNPSIEMKRNRIYASGVTVMAVIRQTPQPKNLDNTADSLYWIPDGNYSAVTGQYNSIWIAPRKDSNVSKYWYNGFNGLGINTQGMNYYDGDQGECTLFTARGSINPNSNRQDIMLRIVTSLGSQKTYNTEYSRSTNASTDDYEFGGVQIGTNAQYSTYTMRGEIGEIIWWSESLSDSDYNKAGQYLSSKWGFTW